jgi:hypothetical protein
MTLVQTALFGSVFLEVKVSKTLVRTFNAFTVAINAAVIVNAQLPSSKPYNYL